MEKYEQKRLNATDAVDLGIQAIENLLPAARHIVADIGLINAALVELRKTKEWLESDDKVLEAAKALLSDIEAMQHGLAGWYGPFETFTTNEWEDTAQVEWPNLAISAQKLKEALNTV